MKLLSLFTKKAWLTIALVLTAIVVGVGIRYVVPKLKEDNVIEELCEKYIYRETGIDTDLTPNSPE